MSQAAFIFELGIAPFQQFRYGMGGKEFRWRPSLGGFPGDGLRAVLAELESGGVILVGPRTPGTIESIGFVRTKQKEGCLSDVHLIAHRLRGRAQSAPPPGGTIVRPDSRDISPGGHRISPCDSAAIPTLGTVMLTGRRYSPWGLSRWPATGEQLPANGSAPRTNSLTAT